MDRRSFIKLTAIGGTSATLASCGVPQHEFIRFVPEEELPPGIAEWRPSVCPVCASGCGLNVRVMDADVETTREGQKGVVRMGVAKKLEGLAAHPINEGGLCARGQAAIQITYHPDRLTQPLKRGATRGDGQFTAISWDDAIAEVVSKIDALNGDGKALAAIVGPRRSQRRRLMDEFLTKSGAAPAVVNDLFGDDVLRRANDASFGVAQLPTLDFKNARSVISFGADFLGTWNSVVGQNAGYGYMRRGRPGVRGAFFHVESRMTTTGASADEWIAVTPGTEGVLALGIAHVLREHKLVDGDGGKAGSLIAGWSSGLEEYTPENVAKRTGVSAERIERIAHELASQRPAAAIIAGPPLAHTNGYFSALAVNALNALLGSVGQPGGIHFTPQIAAFGQEPARQSLDTFAAAVLDNSQATKVLLVDEANPAYASPKSWKVKEAIAKIPFVVSFSSFIDDTSVLADIILPDSSFLESWVDATQEAGALTAVASVAAPAMKPLFKTRPAPDVLLEISGKLAKPLGLPWQTFDEMLKASFDTLGEDAFTDAQKQAGWWGDAPQKSAAPNRGEAARSSVASAKATPASAPAVFAEPTFNGDAQQYPFHFLPYPSIQFGDGSTSHLPWLQELPDPTTTAMWSSWVEINPKTAAELNLGLGDVVEIASTAGALRTAVFINPAIAPDIVAMPVGQGHTTFTRYASGRGANPLDIVAAVAEPTTGALAWAATRVKVTRVGDPDGKLILFSARGELRERPNEGATR